jgi:protein-tyrosine phosphatase
MVATNSNDEPRRIVALKGAYNVRDLGGYAVADGRSVRWGRVFRSAALADITPDDAAILLGCGIRSICDLRSGDERLAAPNNWGASTAIEFWARPATEIVGDSRRLLQNCLASPARTRATLTQVYREMPFTQASAYAHIFKSLLAGRAPLLFHCSAGKDRSGVAAALLLSALGVAPEQVLADYLLSSSVHERMCETFISDKRHADAVRDSARSWMPLMEADPLYLAAMFDEVQLRCGSLTQYLSEQLDIRPPDVAKLQAMLLE